MPRLTKADVARHLKISRQTLYDWISKGRISVGGDGLIDSSEVARVSSSVNQSDVSHGRQHGQVLTSTLPDTTVSGNSLRSSRGSWRKRKPISASSRRKLTG
jgi:Helix-turn-helix domain